MDSPSESATRADQDQSDAVTGLELASLQEQLKKRALETFGTEEKALHWLHRRNQIFSGKTPIEAFETEPDAVEQELVRIDHGIYI